MEPTTSPARYYSFIEPSSSGVLLLIRALLRSYGIPVGDSPISALVVERSGGEWFLLIRREVSSLSFEWEMLPAKSIQINGTSLDHFLEAVAKG